jgi:hypothetical protein
MKPYRTFSFDACRLDMEACRLELCYSLDEAVRFTETVTFPHPWRPDYPRAEAEQALRTLHLLGGASYFKTCLPPEIQVRPGPLAPDEAAFYTAVYQNGLGEFFYHNNLDPRGRIAFPAGPAGPPILGGDADDAPGSPTPNTQYPTPSRILAPIGGGKDSVVTAELLKAAGLDVTLFRVGAHPLITECAEAAGLPLLTLERRLAPELFELNRDGALNGHVPITAYVSCLAVLTALLYGFDTVAFSNERSASEGNTQFHGLEVNHQWSKSLSFERDFQRHLREHVTGSVSYCSVLRPLSELQIARLFCRHPQYFDCTTSCNANWRILKRDDAPASRWCGACPKCAFAYALFAAFLPAAELRRIFGADFFSVPALLPLYRQLLGTEGFKPFECVGTADETIAAFRLAYQRAELNESPAMRLFAAECLNARTPESLNALVAEAFTPSPDHALPPALAARLPADLFPCTSAT